MRDAGILIDGFEPLRFTLPPGAESFEGRVLLVLPELDMRLMDLSLGGAVPGSPRLVSHGRVLRLEVTLRVEALAHLEPGLKQAHELAQERLMAQPLLGPGPE